MPDATLAVAILLTTSFAIAQLGRMAKLPSVTGYICAGILLGPSGLNLITEDLQGDKLAHFTQIALMLIAIGIGEHMEIRRIRKSLRMLLFLCAGEIIGTLLLVGCGIYLLIEVFGGGVFASKADQLVAAMLLGSISVATAPGTTLLVLREARATGPLSQTILQTVAVNNGMAIMLFGFALAIARTLTDNGDSSFATAALAGCGVIILSLALGVITGLVIEAMTHRLKSRAEMLTGGLALLLLSGEAARLLSFSPLLVGMAVGFTIVNRDRRDVRLFRLLNDFAPPIHVLFFTLAGAHLNFSSLKVAGWLGLLYFLLRATGKTSGAWLGGIFGGAPAAISRYLGIALVPQAGIAVGLAFLINSDPHLSYFGTILTPTILTGVLLAELTGPLCARYALHKTGESVPEHRPQSTKDDITDTQLVPWSWEKLSPATQTHGAIAFGVSQETTAGGLARIATLLAHHYRAIPLAMSIEAIPKQGESSPPTRPFTEPEVLFDIARKEASAIGYPLNITTIRAERVATGLIDGAQRHHSHTLILGYPLQHSSQEFRQVVEQVVSNAGCQVVLVRLIGILHTERILVPIVHTRHLEIIEGVLCALARIGQHRITLLRILSSGVPQDVIDEQNQKLHSFAQNHALPFVRCLAVATETRLDTILAEADQHDLILMAGVEDFSLPRKLFGSLADDVALRSGRPMMIIYSAKSSPGTSPTSTS